MCSAQRHTAVDRRHMDAAVESGEHETRVGQECYPGDGAGKAAEAVAVVRVECGEVEAAWEVEDVNGAVGEARG